MKMPESKLKDTLRHVFGFDGFRPLQANIIADVQSGKDTLVVMPTGSGKSLCYQLPALHFSGLTVVVSPLISLMEDQVMQLRQLGVAASFLNSSLSYDEYLVTTAEVRTGRVKLLYAAPETLLRPDTLALLAESRVDCLTIDEAHCISEWGHDFRPEYRQLVDLRRQLPDAVCLAVTATATERVRTDIKSSLAIPDAQTYVASFDRENLFLAADLRNDDLGQALAFLAEHRDQSGIIYCTTRRQVDSLTDELAARGWPVLPYHAGLDAQARRRNQQRWVRDDVPIMVATIAFGMGINKPDVRFILHVGLPKNLESYYQQIGRAGRDGLRADCLLLFSYGDVSTINYFISQKAPDQQRGARRRLDSILAFVDATECRRRPLLTYFGEEAPDTSCDFCDICTGAGRDPVDLTIPAQKFLSCVKRTGERFGVTYIIDVLRGSRSQKILNRGHDRLSTYNIGGEYPKTTWRHLARQFIQGGLLHQDPEHGGLRLTPQAYAVFKGEKFAGTMPEAARSKTTAVIAQPHDGALFQLLRRHRKALADAANVPPYAVFADRSLVEMAAYFPHSRQAFAQIYGVGEAKLARYADEFLPIIAEHCAANGLAELPRAGAPTRPRSKRSNSRHGRRGEAVAAFNDGRTIAEIAAELGVKTRTVVRYLWDAVQAGEEISAPQIEALLPLSEKEQSAVRAAFARHGVERLRPVFDALGERVTFDSLHLMRLLVVSDPHSRPATEPTGVD